MRSCITKGKRDKRRLAYSDNDVQGSRVAHDEIAMEAGRLAKEKHKK